MWYTRPKQNDFYPEEGSALANELQGKCVLITRARHQAQELIGLIEGAGGEAVAFPVITTADPDDWAPVDAAIARCAQYRWLVLTSPNGVRQFVQRLQQAQVPVASFSHMKVVAVGTATAQALSRHGFHVDLIPDEFLGAAIPLTLRDKLKPGEQVLMPRGDLANPALPEALRRMGALVDDVTVYRTVPDPSGDAGALADMLQAGRIDYVTFTSGSTVRHLLQRLGSAVPLQHSKIACIGPETAKVAEGLGLTVHLVASPFTTEGLFEILVRDSARKPR